MMERLFTKELAELIVSSRPDLNGEAGQAARSGIIDYLASGFAAEGDEGVAKLWRVVEAEGGTPVVPVVGQSRKAGFLHSAPLNGFIGHALDYDDVHSDVRGHPSTVILPALLSAASTSRVSGERFLAAYIVGVEVMARLGRSIGSDHYVKGWHNTSTLGVIAAARAAGYFKGFSVEQMEKVIGFAATQSSGMRIQFGTETKPLHAGFAAQAAPLSVRLTEENFGGTQRALDGKIGFFGLYGDAELAGKALLEGWGEPWRIVTPGLWFKIYPFCSAAHHAADAAIRLKENPALGQEEIRQVEIIFPSGGDAALIEKSPLTGEQGRFSVEYVTALALNGYSLALESFTNRPIPQEILDFMSKVHRKYDDSIEPAPNAVPKGRFTIVQVTTSDGNVYSERVDCPRGAPGNALSLKELQYKPLTSLKMDRERTELLTQTIKGLRTEDDLRKLLSLL
ncbi:MmgE/PrpD family protein [Paenibacillus sp. P26]|nr:MmgE/PrpD family protein [Paenibacillus sp. P26]